MNLNSFEIYLNNIQAYIKKENKDNLKMTHLLMNGGRLHIPEKRIHEFEKRYAQSLTLQHKMFVIELKTDPYFRLYMDLDFFEHVPLNKDVLKSYVAIIQKSIWEAAGMNYSAHESRVLVCINDNKETTKNGNVYVKTGVHLHWPCIHVDSHTSLMLRNMMIHQLKKEVGNRHEDNSWEDVLDRSVLEGNTGLRKYGSNKMSKCAFCKSKNVNTKDCAKCNGKGSINEGRAYRLLFILDGKGKELSQMTLKLQSNIHKLVLETSIRCTDESNKRELNIPLVFQTIPSKYSEKKTKGKNEQLNTKNMFDIVSQNRTVVGHNTTLFRKLTHFVRNHFPKVYSDIELVEILKLGTTKEFYLARSTSKFCLNINKEHNSNNIYFYFDKSFAYQKCFCTCNTTVGRQNGLCAEYRSAGRKIPYDLQKLMYPAQKDTLGIVFDIPRITPSSSEKEWDNYTKSLQEYCNCLFDEVTRKTESEDKNIKKI